MKISLVLAVALVFSSSLVSAQGCYADVVASGSNLNFNFATKTSYKFIQNTNTDPITLPGNRVRRIHQLHQLIIKTGAQTCPDLIQSHHL